MKNPTLTLCLSLAALTLASCFGPPRARIMGDDEPDKVGVRRGGAAAFNKLIRDVQTELVQRPSPGLNRGQMRRAAFVNLENRTAEELGEWRDLMIDRLRIGVSEHPEITIISEQMVGAVLGKMGNPPVNELFLPAGRRKFAAILEQESSPVDMLIYGSLTRGTTQGEGVDRQIDYLLTLEIVDVKSGESRFAKGYVRKEVFQ